MIIADTVVFFYLQLQTDHFGIRFPSTRQKPLRDFTHTGEAIAHLDSPYVWDGTLFPYVYDRYLPCILGTSCMEQVSPVSFDRLLCKRLRSILLP